MLRSLVGSEMCIRDRYQRRVREIEPSAMAALRIESGSSLTAPTFDADGELFVCSNMEGKVQHVGEKALQQVSDEFNTPSSIGFDCDGMMYVCDMAHGAVCECQRGWCAGDGATVVQCVSERTMSCVSSSGSTRGSSSW
eukprot:TRINITY_DN9665_c0_g1_i2.p2 TRINITY_DN9665_c0_g1~~TRINITY_DN9665_c0_g1_i2.p2  ORF type:complete len:139 (+),score=33.46 TRINITY_DN9665_c0_g1_i2:138-554(+)